VGQNADWQHIDAFGNSTCGIRSGNLLKCWGNNDDGQLGVGDTRNRRNPTRVRGNREWLTVAGSGRHVCAVHIDHTAFCWGSGYFGQLGNGRREDKVLPNQVGVHDDWVALDGGSDHSCGLRANGTLWCWGYNTSGQLGIGDARELWPVPLRVGADRDWAMFATGGNHTCGIRTDRSLWCWGDNYFGQLGDGTRVDKFEPTLVEG
jgi:alpha-tubulin suppressor-like RCC1 family protein